MATRVSQFFLTCIKHHGSVSLNTDTLRSSCADAQALDLQQEAPP